MPRWPLLIVVCWLLTTLGLVAQQPLTDSRYLAPESPGSPKAYNDPEAYAVYAAVLPTLWPSTVAHAERLVICRETRSYKMCLQPGNEWESLLKPAIDDYLRLSKNNWLLQDSFLTEKPCELLSFDEIHSMEFGRRQSQSGGWIELSPVGFNADKTIAVVYTGWFCGPLCGGGKFHIRQKKDGKWVPLQWNGLTCCWRS